MRKNQIRLVCWNCSAVIYDNFSVFEKKVFDFLNSKKESDTFSIMKATNLKHKSLLTILAKFRSQGLIVVVRNRNRKGKFNVPLQVSVRKGVIL